jgi:hypothetical protein
MGFVVAALLFAGAFFVWYYNQTHVSSYLLIPLLDRIPSLRGDPEAQAEWSWRITFGLAVFVLVANVVAQVCRAGRKRSDETE